MEIYKTKDADFEKLTKFMESGIQEAYISFIAVLPNTEELGSRVLKDLER
jgi:hypothetical protein